MFDYKLLNALAAVVEQAGFERAASVLGLSQSAISQRIKLLEARVGQPVLFRQTPPLPTAIGKKLLNHVQQVRLLERDLNEVIPGLEEAKRPERLRIAVNADSLATWWGAAMGAFFQEKAVLFDLVVEDQDVALKRMHAGEVAACLCAQSTAMAGARSLALGSLRYLALASPAFIEKYLSCVTPETLAKAPAIVFGPDDQFQHRYLATLGYTGAFDYHLCPSSEGFLKLALAGLGWGMLPEAQAQEYIAKGALKELVPGRAVDVMLYWHHWRNGSELMKSLTTHLAQTARQVLLAT